MLHQVLETSFYRSSLIAPQHAMFTCQGGVSQSPYTGLNLSYGVGDDPAAVRQNRELVKQQLNVHYLASAVQVHSDCVAVVEGLGEDYEYKNVDALITQQSGVGLLIQQADCQAILLYDPKQQAVAAVHNGWQGSVKNIIAQTIRAMEENFCTSPRDVRAVISPSLGPCCAEFIHYNRELLVSFQQWQRAENHFDFWKISRWQLQEAGLHSSSIEVTGICTLCNQNFFSYRRAIKQQKKQRGDKGVTGRNGSVIALAV
ncbi:MAG: peptidoglycan editing factor PgeF [Candidatus Electrothrix sp. AW1]|nr:peptidoglycan editing factor PgeF [Candidatus Electrothrix sp. AX1]MCI5181570.1 peptidoglycan editing factor PgeF [Candidatus Electrothrix gigas]